MYLDCTCFRIRRLSRQITQIYDEELRPTKLRVTQLSMLAALRIEESLTVAALAKGLGADPTSISRALQTLSSQNLVVLNKGSDKRSKSVVLTNLGTKKLKDATPYWEKAQARVAELLGPHLRSQFDSELDKVSEKIECTQTE